MSEAFYNDCLTLYAEKGIAGLREFFNKCPRNKEIFYNWLAKWAEKHIKQGVEVGGKDGEPIQHAVQFLMPRPGEKSDKK